MIVVTTPTGNLGSKLLPLLLAAGQRVRVVARDPSKLPAEIQRQVEIVQGSTDDLAVLHRAFHGAESLFWVAPPSFQVDNVKERYLRFAHTAIEAARAQGLQRIVGVSSLGRHLGRSAGVISASHAQDALFESSGIAYRALWNPGFMENMLRQLPALKHQGAFFQPSKPDLKIPHAAGRDIAASAAKLLLDPSWRGAGGLAVLGPQDLSPDDQAAILTEVLGKPIRFQPVSGAAYKQTLLQHGASEAMAQSLVEMYAAIDDGLYNSEPRTPESATPTSFRQWCEEVLRPVFFA